MDYGSHLHLCQLGCQGRTKMGCPEELRGMQNAAALLLTGNFGKHLSCPLWLMKFVAIRLRK